MFSGNIVLFLWLKTYAPLYQRLSFNVMREICEYIELHIPPPFLLYPTVLFTFDHNLEKWTKVTKIKGRSTFFSGYAAVFCNDYFMLICGGYQWYKRGPSVSSRSHLLDLGGQLYKAPSLISERTYHTLVCIGKTFYTFGGDLRMGMKSAEKWTSGQERWCMLRSMRTGRTHVSSAVRNNNIYLCSWNSQEIEYYNTVKNIYFLLAFTIPYSNICGLAITPEWLIVISEFKMQKLALPNPKSIEVKTLEFPIHSIKMNLIATNGFIYCTSLAMNCCQVIEISTCKTSSFRTKPKK